jgi:hypothetical protein
MPFHILHSELKFSANRASAAFFSEEKGEGMENVKCAKKNLRFEIFDLRWRSEICGFHRISRWRLPERLRRLKIP